MGNFECCMADHSKDEDLYRSSSKQQQQEQLPLEICGICNVVSPIFNLENQSCPLCGQFLCQECATSSRLLMSGIRVCVACYIESYLSSQSKTSKRTRRRRSTEEGGGGGGGDEQNQQQQQQQSDDENEQEKIEEEAKEILRSYLRQFNEDPDSESSAAWIASKMTDFDALQRSGSNTVFGATTSATATSAGRRKSVSSIASRRNRARTGSVVSELGGGVDAKADEGDELDEKDLQMLERLERQVEDALHPQQRNKTDVEEEL